ncbi:hypothetical protein Tco_0813752 [Tanacetum coccineum]
MAPLVSTKFVLGLVACQVSYRVGPSSDLDTGSCTRAREVMIFCTIKSKPLALPWGRTPRLDSGVRVSIHCQIGDASITWSVAVLSSSSDLWQLFTSFHALFYRRLGKWPIRGVIQVSVSIYLGCSSKMANKHSIMTREMVKSFFDSYYIPDEVHPTAPGRDRTITQFRIKDTNCPNRTLEEGTGDSIPDSPSPHASVFKRLKKNRSPSPQPRPRKEGGVFTRLGRKDPVLLLPGAYDQ